MNRSCGMSNGGQRRNIVVTLASDGKDLESPGQEQAPGSFFHALFGAAKVVARFDPEPGQ